jgi:hypothetical protein
MNLCVKHSMNQVPALNLYSYLSLSLVQYLIQKVIIQNTKRNITFVTKFQIYITLLAYALK